VLGLVTNVWVGASLLRGQFLLAGLLLIPAGLFDILDGAVARLRGEDSRWGAFLDSVLDRVADVILFGCLFWSLAGQGLRLEAALALLTLVIALCVSHVRAEAEAAGVELTEGYFQRLERYVAMMIGLPVPGALLPALAILTVLGAVTLAQRVWSAVTRVLATGSASGDGVAMREHGPTGEPTRETAPDPNANLGA
jgi:CDP-diacylglycerol---glycerol-3-phosphate 3-phosphatidyltransferase